MAEVDMKEGQSQYDASKMSDSEVKAIAQKGYDQNAEQYLEWVKEAPLRRMKYIDDLLSRLPSPASSKILELGCGAGVPVTQKLVGEVGNVIGNDISEKQTEFARKLCPGATFILGDMTQLQFDRGSFDAAVAFFTLFHLPIGEQQPMLERIFSWLKPGGWLACNFGADADGGHVAPFFGAPMFWVNVGTEGSLNMVQGAGFKVVVSEVLTESLDPKDPDFEIKFLWVLAQKPV